MSINDEWFRYLRASGYTGSLNDMMRQALISETSVDPTPIACTITLTGDIAAIVGGLPFDIDGQSFSVTAPAVNGDYLASTDNNNPTSITSGKRVVECVDTFTTGAAPRNVNYVITSPDFSKILLVFWSVPDSRWEFELQDGFANTVASVLAFGDINSLITIGIDADTGTPIARLDSVPVGDSAWDATANGYFTGISEFTLMSNGNITASDQSFGGTFRTQGLQGVYPAGTLDWCGNPL